MEEESAKKNFEWKIFEGITIQAECKDIRLLILHKFKQRDESTSRLNPKFSKKIKNSLFLLI